LLLPFVPLSLKYIRRKGNSEHPKTLGEHLLKRRLERGMTQKQVATIIGVTTDTYLNWEKDRTAPVVRYYPKILRVLGYDPFPPSTTLADRLRRRRLELGLTLDAAAKLAGVDEGTFRRWERGERRPHVSGRALSSFLDPGRYPSPGEPAHDRKVRL
jgi:transcriptional regulator with XRE-family HTH domain